jgi:hypothetical protein
MFEKVMDDLDAKMHFSNTQLHHVPEAAPIVMAPSTDLAPFGPESNRGTNHWTQVSVC